MSRKILLYTLTVARQKITKTTHEFLKENHQPFFTFYNFTPDVHNKFHIGLSQQHYPESTIFEDTRRISHTMIINYPRNPYDQNDSRS